jgi:hypothetical protein
MTKKNYGSSFHFQHDSNALEYVLFGYCMNKLWIFEVWSIASPKMWVGSTKIVIQHNLQQVYIYGLFWCVFSTTSLLFAYLRKWRSPGFRKTTSFFITCNFLLCEHKIVTKLFLYHFPLSLWENILPIKKLWKLVWLKLHCFLLLVLCYI